jgi:PAS domain S-box-containing protein
MKKNYSIIAWLVVAILSVLLLVKLSLLAFAKMEESSKTRSHIATVIKQTDALLLALIDAETGARGYLITDDQRFLKPYLEVNKSIKMELESLQQMAIISAARQHLVALNPLIERKLLSLTHVIELQRNHQSNIAKDWEASSEGKPLMDSIRDEIRSVIQIEQTAYDGEQASFQTYLRNLFLIIIVVSVITLLATFLFAYWIYRESRQRHKNLVYLETQRLLEHEKKLNKQLAHANTQVQLGEQKLSILLNSIGDAVLSTDVAGRVTFLNPVAVELTGWTLVKAMGRPIEEVFHIINKESRLSALIPVREALMHGTIQRLGNHTVLITADGGERDIADSCAPIRDHAGQVVGAVLIFRDVTQEYATKQSLRDSNEMLEKILATAMDGIMTIDTIGNIIKSINPAAEGLFGYSAAELVGQQFSLVIPELDIGLLDTLDYNNTNHQVLNEVKVSVGKDKEGRVFPIELSISEIWQNEQLFYACIVRNITVRMQIEAERTLLNQCLRDQQFYTRSLIESNIDAILTSNPVGIITDVNKQTELLTGCTRDELIGAPLNKFFTEPTRVDEAITLVLSRKNVSNFELTACARDGKKTPVSFNASTFYDRERRLQGVFVAARDITEQKYSDLQVQTKNVALEDAMVIAENANIAKSVFLSSMSHELRSPLNAILGFAQLLEVGTPTPTTAQQVRLHQIIKAGWYLLDLINEILDLSVIESGKLSLSREPLSLIAIMRECQAMVEAQASSHGIQMNFLPFDHSWFANGDRTRVKQVLINLLSNAIKYNCEHGLIEVKCTLSSQDRIRISIKDTGAGLPPEKLLQLFQPFNRLGQESGGEEGTGIGLVVTKRLIEMMGGTISVESSVGVGSEFCIELIRDMTPQLAVRNTLRADRAAQSLDSQRLGTLLYVEDNPANLMLVEQIVAAYPQISMLSAINGNAGIALARSHLPDIILMDINLPGISGTEAMKILRKDPLTMHIPVIALSANAMVRDVETGLEDGFFRYLTKPIKINEFINALNEALKFSGVGPVNMNDMENKHD